MFNVKNYEYDCTRKCRCRQHGNQITAALTKRCVDNEKLAAFIAKTCCNFCDITDDLGRSAVHMAASVDRYVILEWLLNQGAIINGKDFESGSSALHRAIYYGCIDCAVLLLQYGASLDLLDEDTRSALQNVCRLCDYPDKVEVSANNEILVWGSNKNYNLGIGNESGANTPQSIDYFRKEHISIASVALGAYHSLFVDKRSSLYAVGHGKGGRLGIGNENSLTTPKRVKLPIKNASEVVICISASRKHSLVLTNHSIVFACGLNEDQQLGVRDAGDKLTVFKEVVTLRDYGVEGLIKVIAKDHYSLAHTEKSIYVWGTNYGQFGMSDNVKVVSLPKLMKLPQQDAINFVEANNFATVIHTKDNRILLYFNYKMRLLKPPNYETLKSISVVGGDSGKTAKGSPTALKLLMLTQTNVIFLWYEMTQQFYRCILTHIRLTQIDKIFYKANQVLILSQGDVFKGKCHQVPVPAIVSNSEKEGSFSSDKWMGNNQNRTEISKDHMIRIDLQRLANIDRAVDIFCDDDFSSFSVLQESHMKYFKLPALTPEEYTFKKLYNDVDIYDVVHDVVFHVDSETYPAHKFIVYSRAPGLRDIISDYEDKDIYLNFDLLTGKMFELMLKFMYTNQFPNEDDLENIQQSLGPDSPAELIDVCRLFLNFVEKFQLKNLAVFLNSFLDQQPFYLPQMADKTKYRFNRLHHDDYPELYDVRIVCSGDIELPAHKCILVARLEYFNMMFTHTWAEQTVINLGTVPIEYMRPIVEFLYSSDIEFFRKQNFSEMFLYNMIVYCDQFFIERLRKVCEILILDKITIRKCGDMLDFACLYNCGVLKRGCMDFICQNLTRVLLYKSLDSCEPDTLKCLNIHYRQMFGSVFEYRMITPYSDAIDDDALYSFVDDFQVDLYSRMGEQTEELQKSPSASKLKTKDLKGKYATRQYEREAISSMMESINLNESTKSSQDDKSRVDKETLEIAEKLQAESKNWMKVKDKKDQKKKNSFEHALKANDVLKLEEKVTGEFVPLTKKSEKLLKTPEKESSAFVSEEVSKDDSITPKSVKAYSLNLADFTTPSQGKLSQKQRKRLSSESSSWRSPPQMEETKPISVPEQPNVWGLLPQSPPISSQSMQNALSTTPPTGSSLDPTSFANMMRAGHGGGGARDARDSSNTSFTKILAEERKQREYYERMRTKSLVLTQIEETAIAELKEFYNVDQVTDEIITIERKPMQHTMNFAVWQRK